MRKDLIIELLLFTGAVLCTFFYLVSLKGGFNEALGWTRLYVQLLSLALVFGFSALANKHIKKLYKSKRRKRAISFGILYVIITISFGIAVWALY